MWSSWVHVTSCVVPALDLKGASKSTTVCGDRMETWHDMMSTNMISATWWHVHVICATWIHFEAYSKEAPRAGGIHTETPPHLEPIFDPSMLDCFFFTFFFQQSKGAKKNPYRDVHVWFSAQARILRYLEIYVETVPGVDQLSQWAATSNQVLG